MISIEDGDVIYAMPAEVAEALADVLDRACPGDKGFLPDAARLRNAAHMLRGKS